MKEALEEPVNTGAKVYGFAEDKRFRDISSGCDCGWDEPSDVEECGARDRVVEELREVADVRVVDREMIANIIARIEAKRDHDLVKGLIIGKHCTNSNPGDR